MFDWTPIIPYLIAGSLLFALLEAYLKSGNPKKEVKPETPPSPPSPPSPVPDDLTAIEKVQEIPSSWISFDPSGILLTLFIFFLLLLSFRLLRALVARVLRERK